MVAAARTVLLGLVVAASLVFGVTSAQAANLVLNPGFENDCSGVPCNWSALSSTIARDTVNPHSGLASISAVSSGSQAFGTRSDCFSISSATAYNMGGWYRTTSTGLNDVFFSLAEYSDGSCATFAGALTVATFTPVTTGVWTFLKGQVTTGATVHSAQLQPQGSCPVACASGALTVNFDDVAVQTEPLAVTVLSFSAHRAAKGVRLRWRTGTEANELGFDVYRQHGRRRVRLNRRLLPALGSVSGHTYSFTDRHAPGHRALRYWLQDVDQSGAGTWHGPVSVPAS